MVEETGSLQQCRAAVFDLDDTLIGTYHAYRAAMPWFLKKLGLPTTPSHIEDAFALLGRLRTFRLEDLFFALLRGSGIAPEQARIKALAVMASAYEKILENLTILEGAPEILAEMQRRGLMLGLLSNGFSEWQRRKLAHCGLARYFHSHLQIVSGDLEHFSEKPSSGIFWECIKRLELPPHSIAFIGDRSTDVLGANLAGMVSIMVGTGRMPLYDTGFALECPRIWVEDLFKLQKIWFGVSEA